MQEKIGLLPRSIIRTLERFKKQVFPSSENKIIALQEFQVSRQQMQVSVLTFVTLLLVPMFVNICGKAFLVKPLAEYFWNTYQNQIFLNSFQAQRAFDQIQQIEDILFFESLIQPPTSTASELKWPNESKNTLSELDQSLETNAISFSNEGTTVISLEPGLSEHACPSFENSNRELGEGQPIIPISAKISSDMKKSSNNCLQKEIQQKLLDLAIEYNQESVTAITNLVGDLLTLITIAVLFVFLKVQILILQSFLTESFYSLSNTNRSFIIIIVTDLLVGYHSPKGWKLLTEMFLQHYGFPETKVFILFFIGTFPVILDTIFKYWIFRHLNRISPTTVITYHRMIE